MLYIHSLVTVEFLEALQTELQEGVFFHRIVNASLRFDDHFLDKVQHAVAFLIEQSTSCLSEKDLQALYQSEAYTENVSVFVDYLNRLLLTAAETTLDCSSLVIFGETAPIWAREGTPSVLQSALGHTPNISHQVTKGRDGLTYTGEQAFPAPVFLFDTKSWNESGSRSEVFVSLSSIHKGQIKTFDWQGYSPIKFKSDPFAGLAI